MWHVLFHLFLVSIGAVIGIAAICLIQAGSRFDKEMEMLERSKES